MSDETPLPLPLPRPRRRWHRWSIAGAVVALGGIGVAIGPAAPWLIDNVSDGARIGRIGKLRIEGVSGSWLGDLHARALSLEDEDGVWAEAHDVNVHWKPFDLIVGGATRLQSIDAQSISISRQPKLSEARPPRASSYHVDIDRLRVGRLSLAEAVVGEAGEFTADAAVDISEDDFAELDLNLRRLDSEADHAIAHFRAHDAFALHVDIESDKGGILARLFGAPDQTLKISADGAGHDQSGAAQWSALIGDTHLAEGSLGWTQSRWMSDGVARLDILPFTNDLARRIGDRVSWRGEGAAPGDFTAHAETPFLSVDATGTLDDEWALSRPMHVVATTPRLSAIARETPFEFGQARFEGLLAVGDAYTLEGQLEARELNVLGRRTSMSGPVRAVLDPQRFALQGDLSAPDDAPALFKLARLQTQVAYDRTRGRFTLDHAQITGDAIAINAAGWTTRGDGEYSGDWHLLKLGALFPGMSGEASGRWRAFTTQEGNRPRVWAAVMDGTGANIGGAPEIVPQLTGRAPRLDGRFLFENGGVTVEHARIEGAQVRAAATGRVVRGQSDLHLEATARGPLTIGDAEIAGAVDATGQLTGPIVRPTLRAHAQLASFTAAGATVQQPDVVFTLAPAGNAYRGQAEMHGQFEGQPTSATSTLVIANSTLNLNDLVANVAALEGRGTAQISPRGASAQLVLGGRLDGLAPLTPQTVTLDAQIADARAGELRIRAATISASGPYRAIDARFDMHGALRRAPLNFAGTAQIAATDSGTNVAIQGQGALAGAQISTRAPLTARWRGAEMEASMDMIVADGSVTGHWTERGRVLQGVGTIGETPIAPLAAIWGERATGRIAGDVNIVNTGGGLSGDARVTLTDARFAGRQRGALTGTFTAHLDPGRLTAQLDAQSSDGLVAHFEADAPVNTSAAPIRVALAPQRRGRASWSVRGRAGSLWAAARLPDQDLDGDLTGEGELTFGDGYLAGDGHIQIANGRFEDKLSGVKLENVDAAVAINQDGVTVQRFTANDSRGGRIIATGGSANPRAGRIGLEVQDLRLVDRPDAKARASGQLTFEWQGLESTLSGNLAITEADVSVAQSPQASIPTIEVVEINRPGGDEDEEPARRQAFGATKLDIRITAPGRVFTRGRGVEAEWQLDLRLAGTNAAPLLFGEAQTLRGTLSLSGQPFEIDTGHIYFNGAPMDARINLAATRDTADLTARILLSGTAADPDISFTSTPPLPEDEILPQVLFGHSVEDLNGIEAAQLAASLAALSGKASFDLVDAARAVVGLDRFNVRQEEGGGFLVAGGVYLTRGVYVELQRTGLGQAATRVEWTIRPRLVLITSFLGNGDQRASIRWRREGD